MASIAENLQCSICSDIFRNPRALPCGHSYCGPPRNCLNGIKYDNDQRSKCAICNEIFQFPVSTLKPLYGIREAISSLFLEENTAEGNCNHAIAYKNLWCVDCSAQVCSVCVDTFHFDHNLKNYKAILMNKLDSVLPQLQNIDLLEFQIASEMKQLQKRQHTLEKISRNKSTLLDFAKSKGNRPLNTEISEMLVSNSIESELQQIANQVKLFEFTVTIDNIELYKKGAAYSPDYCLRKYNFRILWTIEEENEEFCLFLYLGVESLNQSNKNWKIRLTFRLVLVNFDVSKSIEKGFVKYDFEDGKSVMGYSSMFAKSDEIGKEGSGFIFNPATITVKVQIQELILL